MCVTRSTAVRCGALTGRQPAQQRIHSSDNLFVRTETGWARIPGDRPPRLLHRERGCWSRQLRLWRTDGTRAGTYPVSDPLGTVNVNVVGVVNGTLIAGVGTGLLRSDGTVAGTFAISDSHVLNASHAIVVGGRMFFDGTSASNQVDRELMGQPGRHCQRNAPRRRPCDGTGAIRAAAVCGCGRPLAVRHESLPFQFELWSLDLATEAVTQLNKTFRRLLRSGPGHAR